MDRGGLDRHGANGVVWAAVDSRLVDRQELDKLQSNFRCPVDKLPQRTDVTDPQIVRPAQRKQRHEHSRDLFFGRKIHPQKNDE